VRKPLLIQGLFILYFWHSSNINSYPFFDPKILHDSQEKKEWHILSVWTRQLMQSRKDQY